MIPVFGVQGQRALRNGLTARFWWRRCFQALFGLRGDSRDGSRHWHGCGDLSWCRGRRSGGRLMVDVLRNWSRRLRRLRDRRNGMLLSSDRLSMRLRAHNHGRALREMLRGHPLLRLHEVLWICLLIIWLPPRRLRVVE